MDPYSESDVSIGHPLCRWAIRLLPTYLADVWPSRMLAADARPHRNGALWFPWPNASILSKRHIKVKTYIDILWMEEILHQLIGGLSHFLIRFQPSEVMQDFFHPQYVIVVRQCQQLTVVKA